MTLEAMVIVPTAFLTVCLMIYIVMLLFDRNMNINSAGRASIDASVGWKESEDLSVDLRRVELYWRLFSFGTASKARAAAEKAEAGFLATGLERFTYVKGAAKYRNNLINKSIEAGLANITQFPEETVVRHFRLPEGVGTDIRVRTVVPDYPEFIRSTDLVLDIEKEIERASPEFRKVADNFRDAVGKIREYIGRIR